jgi:hypothetical protein
VQRQKFKAHERKDQENTTNFDNKSKRKQKEGNFVFFSIFLLFLFLFFVVAFSFPTLLCINKLTLKIHINYNGDVDAFFFV